MKNLFVVLMSLVVLFSFGGLTTNAAGTDVDLDWVGSGSVGANFQAGDDAVVSFSTYGGGIEGEFYAQDDGDDPCGYGVDTVKATVNARVYHGGDISFIFNRNDSNDGLAGQTSNSYVWSSNGYAGMIYQGRTNFYSLKNSQYGFRNDNQFFASGSDYVMSHGIGASGGNGALVTVVGESGNARITSMCSYAKGNSFKFGTGVGGCHTNSNVDAVGSGKTVLEGFGTNHLEGKDWFMPSGGSYVATWSYNDGAEIDDTWIKN